ncbi:ATP synthase F1 subunit epsilon [Mycoplasmopsis felifaucium]|uniref:ATP synthase F1 subunit epsilon n=1 Tax=Mycoplasmopsis felifaucium TaxID=35768 RepID=UPI0004811D3D|nr:ATP synthase F1 subunit epsilon [Mycoplasmopsis felifaucium]
MYKYSNLKIITQSQIFYDGEVSSVQLSTKSGGQIMLQPNRSEFLSTIDICKLFITVKDNQEPLECSIGDGIVYVDESSIRIITNDIIWSKDIDVEKAEKDRDYALKQLENAKNASDEKLFEIKLRKAINRINVSKDRN